MLMIKEPKKKLADYWIRSGTIKDKRIIKAFEAVPREDFITPEYAGEAYGDYPLPIGYGQTISQPTTVMIMTQALEIREGDRVLEVGAGSGYQAAIISKLVGSKGKVITTEIISLLAVLAENNLRKAGIGNVEVVNWDGSSGYEKEAPYDRIIVTAASPQIPEELVRQLKEGGIIVAPVGQLFIGQEMIKAKKVAGKLKTESLGILCLCRSRGNMVLKDKLKEVAFR